MAVVSVCKHSYKKISDILGCLSDSDMLWCDCCQCEYIMENVMWFEKQVGKEL